jgi:hypothetical protein
LTSVVKPVNFVQMSKKAKRSENRNQRAKRAADLAVGETPGIPPGYAAKADEAGEKAGAGKKRRSAKTRRASE